MTDYSNPFVLVTTIAEYITFVVVCIIDFNIYKRFKERKNHVAFLLLMAFIFFAFAPIFQTLDTFFLDDFTTRELGYIASFGYASAMITSGIANYFLIHFTYEVFLESKSRRPTMIGIFDIITTIVFFLLKVTNSQIASTIVLGGHLFFSLYIYFSMFYYSVKSSKKFVEKLNRRAFQLIGLTGLFLVLTFLCFIFEAIVYPGQFSVYGSLGWLFAIAGVVSSYIGFVLPPWFRHIYEKKDGNKS